MDEFMIQQYVYWDKKEEFLYEEDTEAYYVLYLIMDGKCWYKTGEHKGLASKGTIILAPPFVPFSRKVISPLSFHFFRFSVSSGSIDLTPLLGKQSVISESRTESTHNFLIESEMTDNEQAAAFRNHLLKDILYSASDLYFLENQANIRKRVKDDLIYEAMAILTDPDYDTFDITDIAMELGLNNCYFSRKFKSWTGVSPVDFRNKERIKRAQKMLTETTHSIEEVAEKCGFCNGFYFNRVFKKYLGVSPSIYRKNHQI